MNEASNGTRFCAEPLHTVIGQLRIENFDRRLSIKIDVLAKVDLGEASLA